MKPAALSTHVLDTAAGCPAVGVAVELWRMGADPVLVAGAITNADGRTDAPLLASADFQPGRYELRFAIGAYFRARGEAHCFLDVVALNVGLLEGQGHYHVPLLCSPWSYSTYRGS
jgi:5-hydroxyisourate hydrolase